MTDTSATTTDDANFATPREVRFDRILNAPIERVWEYLANDQLRETWLGGGTIELVVGGRANLWYDNSKISDQPQPAESSFEPHFEDGTVVAVDPPRLLSYTWGEWFGKNCIVTFALEPMGDRTHLTLTHSRIEPLDLSYDVARGWHGHLDFLAARIDGTPLPKLWDRFDELSIYYSPEGKGPAQ